MDSSRYKFRGKRVDNGEWVKGWYLVYGKQHFITNFANRDSFLGGFERVIPESVGQNTGFKDREGKDIYGKDIVKLCYGIPPTFDTLLIEYADDETVGDISVSGWWMRNIRPNGVSGSLCKTYENDLEIIGNATDNPELLTEKSHA